MIDSELSIWHLISEASLVVQLVMAILVLASVVSWMLIIQRAFYLKSAKRHAVSFEGEFWSGADLRQIYTDGTDRLAHKGKAIGLEAIFRSGYKEFNRLVQRERIDRDNVMKAVQRAMRIAISREQDQMEKHLPFLASVASVSPYIGLFGTVWGIMNSFRGLAQVHQATLATVAPGISEALIATAMGLFAAIPAVLAYNRYAALVDSLSSTYGTFAEEFSNVLHRSIPSKAA